MKKILTILLAVILTGTMMTTVAMADTDATDGANVPVSIVLITAKSSQGGEIAVNEQGGEPIFAEDEHLNNVGVNIPVGNTVAFSAKADEGYKFLCWINKTTGEIYSTDETISFEATAETEFFAAFDLDVERVLIIAKASTGGQVSMNEDGGDPEFPEGEHTTEIGGNIPVGNTVIFGAKADEGYKFFYWLNKDTNDIISEDETISFEAETALNLLAVFDLDVERVLIIAEAGQGGKVAMSIDGNDPEFSDGQVGNAGGNIPVGDSVIFGAKADEGYEFDCWKVKDTEEVYSKEAIVNITAEKALTLQAVFKSTNKPEQTPKTGDTSSFAVVLMMVLSLCGIASAVVIGKKRNN